MTIRSQAAEPPLLPEGLFVWATLKNRCAKYVRSPTTTTDFGPLLLLSTRARDTFFGRHSQGIRDELKFRDRSLFQFTLIECTT